MGCGGLQSYEEESIQKEPIVEVKVQKPLTPTTQQSVNKKTIPKPKTKQIPPPVLQFDRFFTKKTIQFKGGYFVAPKRNELLQKTQILVSAPTFNQVKISAKAAGKVGLIAVRPGPEFPLSMITDVLQSSQIADNYTEMIVDTPAPSGFVVYIISEGQPCDVEIDGLGKAVLELAYGDLKYEPPVGQLIGQKKAKLSARPAKLTSVRFVSTFKLQMHGGFIAKNEQEEEIDDNQFIVQTSSGTEVKISAKCNGKVGLMILRKGSQFPLQVSTDILAYGEPVADSVETIVKSPGPEGFIVYLMSNSQLCDVNVDGMGRLLACVSYGDDHIPTRRESSISNSSRSSALKKVQYTAPVKQHTFINNFNMKFKGGAEIDQEPGTDIFEQHQLLICAPTGNKVKIGITGIGKVGIMVMQRDSFPLSKTTGIITKCDPQADKTEIVVESPGPTGFICYFVGNGKIEATVNGMGAMILEIAHAETM
ncbi:Conserved_hypothetical protein [Hexamita inflata]|uniref:Uncharacterized protein n=1 Tax=Hexamita inflata TaxID=28002 RepID=A0AA86QQP0_9EUKA|nr:Conserved hypothetical protein [Hexamita inflata]